MTDLSDNLMPVDSPIARNQGAVSAYEFNSQNERNTVDLTKIKNFSFSSGQGGTLTLGGTANGNGYFQIKNEGGSVIVTGDKNGITVSDGSIVINDTGGTLVVDSSGIKSTTQFPNGGITVGSISNTSSTSFVDVPGASITFSLSRTANILVIFDIVGLHLSNSGAGGNCYTILNVDGTAQAKTLETPGRMAPDASTVYGQTAGASSILTLGAGSHTLKLQYRTTQNEDAYINFPSITYTTLGK